MRPKTLERRFERKKEKYFNRLYSGKLSEKKENYIGQKLYFMKEYIKTIGFRRIPHKLEGAGASLFEGVREDYIFPAIGTVQYNDRAFREAYKCKDQPIELEGWEGLLIEDCDLHEYDDLTRKQPKEKDGKDEKATA